ncbi:hypothetical protein Q3G72_016670 [Acer saccharum]|nr:hypothetical protein Q3G72_016670 [Acer saccharum]
MQVEDINHEREEKKFRESCRKSDGTTLSRTCGDVPALCDKTSCNSFTKKRFLTNFKTNSGFQAMVTIVALSIPVHCCRS